MGTTSPEQRTGLRDPRCAPPAGRCLAPRWDSLRAVHTGALPWPAGHAVPGRRRHLIGKDAMADYLEIVRRAFHLPVRTVTRVDGLARRGDRFVVTAGDRTFEADNVVVAMANCQQPKVPPFAADLDPVDRADALVASTATLATRRRPGALVGVGNSGAEIAMELVEQRPTTIAGKEAAHVPVPHRHAHRPPHRRARRALPGPQRPHGETRRSAGRCGRSSSPRPRRSCG